MPDCRVEKVRKNKERYKECIGELSQYATVRLSDINEPSPDLKTLYSYLHKGYSVFILA